jgi:hypothetical protein
MSGPEAKSLTRRSLLAGSGAALGLALTPAALWARARAPGAPAPDPILAAVCALVIPATDTPGALEVGVPAFVEVASAHGISGAGAGTWARVRAALDARAGGSFAALAPAARHDVLAEFDAAAFAGGTHVPPPGDPLADWRIVKTLIVVGYYTSQPGATEELRYEFVPGRYDADIPFPRDGRALMNDWWGNTY